MKRITTILAVVAAFITSARGQGFLNLNFESAYDLTNPPASGADVPTANGLPGWAATNGDVALTYIEYVSNYIDGFKTTVVLEGGSLALDGDFSVGLYSNGSISQTGLVPANAQSLQFEAYVIGADSLSVTLGGVSLQYSALYDGPDYTVYGANIPADLDGQMEALAFLCQGPGGPGIVLDDIEFSPMSVPEPSECALIGLGVVLFGIRHRRRRPYEKAAQ